MRPIVALSSSLVAFAVAGCTADGPPVASTPPPTSSLFADAGNAIAFDTALRRQWGAPVVADLDGDRWDDIVITDHVRSVQVYWNDSGTFSDPVTVIRGDTHGLGVEDYDGDGRMDLVIAQGGGDGGNPRHPIRYIVNRDRSIERAETFSYFEQGRGRAIKFLEANRDGMLDLIYTGFAPRNRDDLAGNELYFGREGTFEHRQHLPDTRDALSFQALVTDFDNDTMPDAIVYAGRDMVAVKGGPGGEFADVTDEVLGPLRRTASVSGITELDYDNDGDMDLLVTRAHKQFQSESYFDPELRRYAFFEFRNEFMLGDFIVDGDLVLDNIQESYATYGIFLGADQNEVEPQRPDGHAGGRLVISPEDARDWPQEELRGLNIGYLGDGRWRIGGNVRSRLAAVVENVVEAPELANRGPLPTLLLENRDGRFIDVTAAMGIDESAQTTGAAAGDFDNDGFIDLALSYYGDMVRPVEHAVLLNRQGQGFTKAQAPGLVSQEVGAIGNAMSVIDFDRDGQLDLVFGNERGRWHLARNVASDNGFAVIEVGRSPDRNVAITGTRIALTACGSTQHRVIGATGDGFHHMASSWVHFGLGDCAAVDRVEVRWTNGETATLRDMSASTIVQAGRQP